MAAASGTNAGAIQRAITREKKDPVIAEKVRKGEMKPADALGGPERHERGRGKGMGWLETRPLTDGGRRV